MLPEMRTSPPAAELRARVARFVAGAAVVSTLTSLAACGASPVRAVRADNTTHVVGAPVEAESVVYRVEWRVEQVTDGCFFFSGPGVLGRDEQLGHDALLTDTHRTVRSLSFGGEAFVGSMAGATLALSRQTVHEGWTVIEDFELTPAPGLGFVGRYRYREIPPGGRVPGPCTIAARLSLGPF